MSQYRRDGGPWNLYYTTSNIRIYGTAKDDAYSDALLAEAGPYDFAALSALPLEDQAYDDPYYAGSPAGDAGGGGAFGVLEDVLLVMFLAQRGRFSRRPA